MSAHVVIVCDHCGEQGAVGATPQEARDGLRGWGRRHGTDLCVLCRFISDASERVAAQVNAPRHPYRSVM